MLQNPQTIKCAYPPSPFLWAEQIFGRDTSRLPVQRSGFEWLACFLSPSVPALGRAGFTLRGELRVQPLKHGVRTVIGAQAQHPTPRMLDHAPGLEHDFLHHRFHAPAFGCMAQWCVFANQRVLANQTQDVHRHRSQSADQEVGVKLATGQALQIHVGLELGVWTWGFAKLFVRGVVFVQINDELSWKRQSNKQAARVSPGIRAS